MLGYDYLSSSLVPSDLSKGSGSNLSALIFGDFSQVLLATTQVLTLLSTHSQVQVQVLLDLPSSKIWTWQLETKMPLQ